MKVVIAILVVVAMYLVVDYMGTCVRARAQGLPAPNPFDLKARSRIRTRK